MSDVVAVTPAPVTPPSAPVARVDKKYLDGIDAKEARRKKSYFNASIFLGVLVVLALGAVIGIGELHPYISNAQKFIVNFFAANSVAKSKIHLVSPNIYVRPPIQFSP